MGLIADLKAKLRERNSPEVIRDKREIIRAETERLKEVKSYEQEREDLRKLRNSTGVRGKIVSGLKSVQSNLKAVKARRGNLRVKDPLADRSKQNNFTMGQLGGGVFGGADPKPVRKIKKRGKTITIRL